VHALREYKWLIAALTAVVLVAGTVWTLRTPKIYEAATTIEYDPNPSRPLGGEVQDVADPIGNYWATREFFGTQNRVIASRDVAERAVQKLGLHEDPSYLTQDDDTPGETGNLEATTLALQSRLTVEPNLSAPGSSRTPWPMPTSRRRSRTDWSRRIALKIG